MVVLSVFVLGCVGGMALAFIALDARIVRQRRALSRAFDEIRRCQHAIVSVANRSY